jgi:hypothetical protein
MGYGSNEFNVPSPTLRPNAETNSGMLDTVPLTRTSAM